MIYPTDNDIGRGVVYTGNRYPGGELEFGVITSYCVNAVFVRYGRKRHSKMTSPDDLEWEAISPTDPPVRKVGLKLGAK